MRRGNKAFCATLILFVTLIAAPDASAQAYVQFVSGEVWIEGASGRSAARAGHQASPGEKVITGSTGSVSLMLADASTIKLYALTTLKIERSRASTTAVSLKSGSISAATSRYRWSNEAFQISTPVITTGVRGTEFSVEVASSGEARIQVDSGVVTAGTTEISAGEGASASFEGEIRAERAPEARRAFDGWRIERREMLRVNRKRVVEGVMALLQNSLQRRKMMTQNILKTIRETFEALKEHEDDLRDAGVAKVARVVTTIRNGVDRAREMLANDREGELRIETLRGLLEEGSLPPFTALGARRVINTADRERAERERGLKHLDEAIEKLGGGLALLAAAVASEPGRERAATKIITEGLGLPFHAEPLPSTGISLTRDDLRWSPGHVRKMIRTVRGREDFRTPVEVMVEKTDQGMRVTRTPLAFDTRSTFTVLQSDTCFYLDSISGLNLITRSRPAMMYKFPIAEGDTWIAWTVPGLFNSGNRIERAVTATEKIRTPAGEFDCLRVETRYRQGNRKKAPLIHVEWLSAGVGQVREISFRGEIRSIAWDELVN